MGNKRFYRLLQPRCPHPSRIRFIYRIDTFTKLSHSVGCVAILILLVLKIILKFGVDCFES